jgi:hypothetical protein
MPIMSKQVKHKHHAIHGEVFFEGEELPANWIDQAKHKVAEHAHLSGSNYKLLHASVSHNGHGRSEVLAPNTSNGHEEAHEHGAGWDVQITLAAAD